jgi:two-component system sensor histidine kinase PilS (NtrC family)
MAAPPPAESAPGRDGAGLPAYRRSFQYFALSRLVVAALLIAYVPIMRGADILDERFEARLFVSVAGLYLALAVAFFLLSTRSVRLPLPRLAALQIAVDVCVLALLMHASGGQRSGLGVLLLLPSAGAAILVGARAGLTFAAASTLLLLAETGWRGLMGQATESAFVQAGLTGATLLVTAAVVGRLALRLASQERLAWRRGEDLRNQLAVTQAVIADLPEGVIVLGARGEPRAINRSARDMLAGGGTAAPLPGLLPCSHFVMQGCQTALLAAQQHHLRSPGAAYHRAPLMALERWPAPDEPPALGPTSGDVRSLPVALPRRGSAGAGRNTKVATGQRQGRAKR